MAKGRSSGRLGKTSRLGDLFTELEKRISASRHIGPEQKASLGERVEQLRGLVPKTSLAMTLEDAQRDETALPDDAAAAGREILEDVEGALLEEAHAKILEAAAAMEEEDTED